MILGELRIWARQAKNAPLLFCTYILFSSSSKIWYFQTVCPLDLWCPHSLSFHSIREFGVCLSVCPSSLQRWPLFLLVGFTDPYNHTYSEILWWKLFKKHKRTKIQRKRQWQRQRQRQRHRQSAWKTQHMLYFWNPDDLLIPNLMIDTSPWSSCSGHTISSTGPSVSPFRDFF